MMNNTVWKNITRSGLDRAAGGRYAGGPGAGRLRRGAGRPDTHAHQDQGADLHAGPAHRDADGGPADRDPNPAAVAHRGADPRADRDAEPPTPEPTVVPPTATPRPVAAKPAPKPVQPPAPAPAPAPVASDPCAGIGGDGCKFRVTGGPSTGDNGGQELKLQLAFIHSGIDGGQPQGSYFVVLEKDGQRLPISDSVRSVTGSPNQGSLGKYNYEYSLGVDKLPGNTVAGNYTLWVLDGNGERDSRNVTFNVPGNNGLIWTQFDQG